MGRGGRVRSAAGARRAAAGGGTGRGFDVAPGGTVVEAPLSASIWRVEVAAGDVVEAGQRLVTLEAMKMETPVDSPLDAVVVEVLVRTGDEVVSGSALVVLGPGEG